MDASKSLPSIMKSMGFILAMLSAPEKKPRQAIVSGTVTLAHNLTNLSNLLSPITINKEVVDLEKTYAGSRPKDFYKPDNTSSMIELWAGQQY